MKAKICDVCCEVCHTPYYTFKRTDVFNPKLKLHMCENCYEDFIDYLDEKGVIGEDEDDVTT